jgi:hypothetical protein
MRPALPAAANAPIASSSVCGARYRISVMVFLTSPFVFLSRFIRVFGLTLKAAGHELTRAKTIRTASRLRRKRYSPMRAAVCIAE